ncbi:tyrosine-type recombinase/integrase [Arthrobacter sp. RHLT1-20]
MAVAYRRLRILTPSLGAYYGVVDEGYRPHELASRWLEVRFFGRAQAETTSAQYASSIALFLTWSQQSGRDLEQSAQKLHLFAAYLATDPQTSGRNAGSPRTAGRINRILVAVREFYRFAIAEGALPTRLLSDLYELPDEREFHSARGPRVRHKRRESRRATAPDQATAAEVTALLDAAATARDRFLILLFALTGMRIGQALGLRRQDLHIVPDAAGLRLPSPTGNSGLCRVPGEHIHVVRRRNPNGAWSKAQFDFAVPAPGILLALYDSYMLERDGCQEAADNDMLLVTLSGATRGCAMSPRNLNKIIERLARTAGLRHIHPHMFRHFAASEHLASGTTRDELQTLLGWSSPASADPYIHVSDDRRRAAVDRLTERLTSRAHS